MDAKNLSKRERLEIIEVLLADVVAGISTIRDFQLQAGDEFNSSFIVAAALGRLGWIAEQSHALADGEFKLGDSSTDAWLLGSKNVLAELRWQSRGEASSGVAL